MAKRSEDARQLNVWLSLEDLQTLEDYRYYKRLASKSAAVRALVKGVRSWLAKERRAHEDEERDDLAEDTGPDYVPRTAGGIEIEPDCPEMAALED